MLENKALLCTVQWKMGALTYNNKPQDEKGFVQTGCGRSVSSAASLPNQNQDCFSQSRAVIRVYCIRSHVFKTITIIHHLISGPSGNSSLHFQLSSVYYFSEQRAHNQEDTRRMGFVASPVGKMKISVVVNHVILGLAVKSKLCKQTNLYSPECIAFVANSSAHSPGKIRPCAPVIQLVGVENSFKGKFPE